MMKKFSLLLLLPAVLLTSCLRDIEDTKLKKGNVIFIHPDGVGLSTWNILRILTKGPDGELNWDKLPNIGLYRSHPKDRLTTSSNAGATMHAYGLKVPYHSFGMNEKEKLKALSGSEKSIMMEAKQAGIHIGIINSGDIIEPGSAVFVASDTSRANAESITLKVIQSKADLILSGGEQWFLPEGVEGRYGTGRRKDSLNVVEIATQIGYHVIYTRDELKSIPANTEKLLGIFAYENTFNDMTEEKQRELGLKNFNPEAPTVAEMTEAAIDFLSKKGGRFFLVVEEEGTDNFANYNNASGTLESLSRADETIGVAQKFLGKNQKTLVLVASDSEAGGMHLLGVNPKNFPPDSVTPEKDYNGAPIDGIEGTSTKHFLAAPDQFGNRMYFRVSWALGADAYGSVVVRAAGLNADLVKGSIQNTDIYKIIYATLFGKIPGV